MNRIRRHILIAMVVTLIGGAQIALPASPVFASANGCIIPYGQFGCSTAPIPANQREHAIVITAFPAVYSDVTCRAHDATNGIEVGSVTARAGALWSSEKVIRGLYGKYFLSCLRRTKAAYQGGGTIGNG